MERLTARASSQMEEQPLIITQPYPGFDMGISIVMIIILILLARSVESSRLNDFKQVNQHI
jgi:hypothetical protein